MQTETKVLFSWYFGQYLNIAVDSAEVFILRHMFCFNLLFKLFLIIYNSYNYFKLY